MQRDVSPMPVSVKKQERKAETGAIFFRGRKQPFLFIERKEKRQEALDFRFLFAYSAGGRGNGKRVAFSSIASLALTNWAPPVENSEP